jgi:hypothetical protein
MLVRADCLLPRIVGLRGAGSRASGRAAARHRSFPRPKHPDNVVGLSFVSGEPMSRTSRFRKLSLSVAVAALAVSGVAGAFTKPGFPRIGGVQVGSPFNYNDSTYQANLAKQSVMILGMYPGLNPGGSMNADVQAIKAKNPNALVFLYEIMDSQNPTSSGAWLPFVTKMNSMKWWLYNDKSLTSLIQNIGNSSFNTINTTLLTPRDSNGDNAIDWMTKYLVTTNYKPNPAIDGFYMDNVFTKPDQDGDWNRDGTLDKASDPQTGTWFRQGYQRYFQLVKSLMPGKYQIGNIGDWANSGAVPAEYQNLVNGGLMEGYMGLSYSIETWGTWKQMMANYYAIIASMLEPKLAIVNMWGDPTDLQTMRYGLTSVMMNDGYFSYTAKGGAYYGVTWFDEFDSHLGQATATPPSAAWQKGVWRRDFENGIALVNPKGNGPQTVTLETAFVKLKGTQDPVTNNGQSVTTVTLKERDGIILLRKNPVKRPAAPKSLTAG